ncbi:MAG: putative transcriptional regulator, TetR family [Devosia sp.]|nr:putative transcriptional regulator, TetR family [Devosia sp.]
MTQTYHHGALREALIVAAETILERDGIAALTLRAAAREAGVSHAAPSHHFGSLSGLLSELAASGFVRLRQHLVDAVGVAGPDRYMAGLSRGYVAFARSSPGLFRLMFRSEQLDWSNPVLSAAGGATFTMLLPPSSGDGTDKASPTLSLLGNAMAHWSMVHGLATLLIDGRLSAVANEMSRGLSVEDLVKEILRSGVPPAH